AGRRHLNAPLRDVAGGIALGELLPELDLLGPVRRRLARVEPRLLEQLLVPVEDDRRALEGNAPRLAAGLTVLHERGEEALEPRLVLGLQDVVERDDRVLVDEREHVGREDDRRLRRLTALHRGEGL